LQAKQLSEEGDQKTFVLVFDTGDEALSGLTEFAEERGLDAAGFTAIGAFGAATLGYFGLDVKEYRKIPVHEQVEVLSLAGNITRKGEGEP
jgi:predicted DNA-binding protein with PD1-like motif